MVIRLLLFFVLCLFDSIRTYIKLFDKILFNTLASDNILSYVCISDLGNGSRIRKQTKIMGYPKVIIKRGKELNAHTITPTVNGWALWTSSVGNDWYEYWVELTDSGQEIGNGYTHHGQASIHAAHDTYPSPRLPISELQELIGSEFFVEGNDYSSIDGKKARFLGDFTIPCPDTEFNKPTVRYRIEGSLFWLKRTSQSSYKLYAVIDPDEEIADKDLPEDKRRMLEFFKLQTNVPNIKGSIYIKL